ncbi:hypothetical protein BDY21DRAFT_369003 [Lineolata rhizophorae]|uniref:Uncharacterized protein n=1 Tax=Lineolata rhizophorae TaxID=578093 RepID=A0A6A6PAA0_9PEZI|nr:hypothetical protein BDY21DRAFT_369003 [Lineolata rhizophorae]
MDSNLGSSDVISISSDDSSAKTTFDPPNPHLSFWYSIGDWVQRHTSPPNNTAAEESANSMPGCIPGGAAAHKQEQQQKQQQNGLAEGFNDDANTEKYTGQTRKSSPGKTPSEFQEAETASTTSFTGERKGQNFSASTWEMESTFNSADSDTESSIINGFSFAHSEDEGPVEKVVRQSDVAALAEQLESMKGAMLQQQADERSARESLVQTFAHIMNELEQRHNARIEKLDAESHRARKERNSLRNKVGRTEDWVLECLAGIDGCFSRRLGNLSDEQKAIKQSISDLKEHRLEPLNEAVNQQEEEATQLKRDLTQARKDITTFVQRNAKSPRNNADEWQNELEANRTQMDAINGTLESLQTHLCSVDSDLKSENEELKLELDFVKKRLHGFREVFNSEGWQEVANNGKRMDKVYGNFKKFKEQLNNRYCELMHAMTGQMITIVNKIMDKLSTVSGQGLEKSVDGSCEGVKASESLLRSVERQAGQIEKLETAMDSRAKVGRVRDLETRIAEAWQTQKLEAENGGQCDVDCLYESSDEEEEEHHYGEDEGYGGKE